MRRRAGFWVLLSLVALLCFLGYLQYRWIDRLAQAEREREEQALHTALSHLAGAFDVEATRAQIAFPPIPSEFDNPEFWIERATTWMEFAPYPRLVKEVYLNRDGRSFKITAAGLVPLSGEVETGSDPIATMPSFGPLEQPRGTRTIVFDGAYIRDELLPRLASRYLNAERYGVRIFSDEGPIFSRAEFKTQVTTRMFTFRPDCFNDRRGPRREGPRDGPREGRREGRPWLEGSASLIARNDVTCTDAPTRRGPGRWTVEAGLTKTAVSGLREFRTRSLFLSFGVLAVLATGIGVLGLYAHRAQILAQRQMEFAMAVSHELRTPLTVIRVAADNLSEGLVTNPRKYGDMIRRETVRLSDMVEQVLVFARTQRSDIRPNFEPVAPADVIERALSAAGPSLESAGMRVEREVAEGLPPMHADANLVSAGLQNLLVNAAKYANEGGVVRVRAERAAPSDVSIFVEDDGPGVRNSELDRIFSPFFRGSDASNSRTPGLGLGLHLVKRIAEAHGGNVRAANREGRGFEVEMRIPAIIQHVES
jgi:signal transduction histidine kinase